MTVLNEISPRSPGAADGERSIDGPGPILVEVRDLAKTFDVSAPWLNRVIERKPRQFLHAVAGVSFANS